MVKPSSISGVRIPEHVVFRPFGTEMVVLNLKTGQYHGLNHSGSRMLEVLAEVGDFKAATKILAAEFVRPVDEIAGDLSELCEALAQRSLLEVEGSAPANPPARGGSEAGA